MAKYSPRIGAVSLETLHEKFPWTHENWERIEAAYSPVLTAVQRERLFAVIQEYVDSLVAERRAATHSEIKSIAKAHTKSFEIFFRWAYGEILHDDAQKQVEGSSDAYREFESLFKDYLTKRPLIIGSGNLYGGISNDGDTEPKLIAADLSDAAYLLRLDMQLISSIASTIAAGMLRIENGNEAARVGFEQGRAVKSFLSMLRDWAQSNNLPFGYKQSGEPGHLARLAFAIGQELPPNLGAGLTSADAVMKRASRLPRGPNSTSE